MYLILHILDKFQAVWLIYDQGRIKYTQKFITEPGEEKVLFNLDKFLHKHHFSPKKFKGFGLIVENSSLTQVKVLTTIINILGWNFSRPVAGIYYEHGPDRLNKLAKMLAKQKKFRQIKVKYQAGPEITVTKKVNKFKLVK